CSPSADFPCLTSFPTRRSSDLLTLFRRSAAGTARSIACDGLASTRRSSTCSRIGSFQPRSCGGCSGGSHSAPPTRSACSARGRRSEEHTSELQSHLTLVCRLLL